MNNATNTKTRVLKATDGTWTAEAYGPNGVVTHRIRGHQYASRAVAALHKELSPAAPRKASNKINATMAQRIDAVVAVVAEKTSVTTMVLAPLVNAELGENLNASQLGLVLKKAVAAGRLTVTQGFRYDSQRGEPARVGLFGGAGACIRRFNQYSIPEVAS